MAEEIKVPGVGPVKQQYVYLGLAAAAGVVGYAWWRAGRSTGDNSAAAVVDPNLIPDTDRTPPTIVDSNTSVDETNSDAITTNGKWTQAATEYLASEGYEGQLVSSALGKYLHKEPLSSTERTIVLAARAAFGDPPEGGPYPISSDLPPTTLAGPQNLHMINVGKNYVSLGWSAVDGAQYYNIRTTGGKYGSTGRKQSTEGTSFTEYELAPNTSYSFFVQAVSKDGTKGPEVKYSQKTTK